MVLGTVVGLNDVTTIYVEGIVSEGQEQKGKKTMSEQKVVVPLFQGVYLSPFWC